MTELLRQFLPIELTNGNDGRGTKWFSSARLRKSLEIDLRNLGHVREPFAFPVSIELVRVLGPRQSFWDVDSGYRGNAKELIDALVACSWFVDDGPAQIREVRFFQDASRRSEGPATLVEVYE